MPDDFECIICKYKTTHKSNYNKHLTTKKHLNNTHGTSKKEETSIVFPKKEETSIVFPKKEENTNIQCIYCDKIIRNKYNIQRHYNTCKKKEIFELVEEHNEIKQKLIKEHTMTQQKLVETHNITQQNLVEKHNMTQQKLRKEIDDLKQQQELYDQLQIDHQELQKKYVKYLEIGIETKGNTTNSNNITHLTANYIMSNFTEAYNFEDVMNKEITSAEWFKIKAADPTKGCTVFLDERCVNGLATELRPIHCTDPARNNYMVKTKERWVTDERGGLIVDATKKIVGDKFVEYVQDPGEDMDKMMDIQEKIYKMRKAPNGKILQQVNNKTMLKNIHGDELDKIIDRNDKRKIKKRRKIKKKKKVIK